MPDRLEREPALATVPYGDGPFGSILFPGGTPDLAGVQEPSSFADLNLDQVLDAVLAGREEYDLEAFFYHPLPDAGSVSYRLEIVADLERTEIRGPVVAFAEEMRRMRGHLTQAHVRHYQYERQRWFLDAAEIYRDAVVALADALAAAEPGSCGLRSFCRHLAGYTASEEFGSLAVESRTVREGLDAVRYTLRIRGSRVTVSPYQGERDSSVEVEQTFARFRQGEVDDHLVKVADSGSMDHVEARIVALVARLNPEEFAALDRFCARRRDFVEPGVAAFDREVQFYLAYAEHIERLERAGLSFCLPVVSREAKESSAEGAFDLALAAKLASRGEPVVRNDFVLRDAERVLVVTGPNQGGKTTFARMFGQLHHLAALGLPVPAQSAQLFLADRVLTHFEVEEDIATLRGKLDDELVRMRDLLDDATGDSVVVFNEIFASTTLADAVYLGKELLRRIRELNCVAVCVTFVDELSALDETTVSMVATVDPDDPSRRTFEIVRRPADGRAYAWAIADKYGLSYERLRRRLGG